MSKRYSLGVDIGGTKIAAGLVNRNGEILFKTKKSSKIESSESLFDTVIECIEEVMHNAALNMNQIYGLGVGVPGKVDIEKGVAIFQNNIPWENFPLVKRLNHKYGSGLNITIDNDVKMAAFAEYKQTILKENDLFTYVTISTGIAATSIVNNTIIRGSGFSGEVGFLPVSRAENDYISLEKYASGTAIAIASDESNSAKEVFEKAKSGEVKAREIIEERAHGLALGLYSIICVLDPKSIVIGGSVAYHNPNFVERIISNLSELVVPEQKHILNAITVSQLGGDNGLVGAGLKAFTI